MRTKGCQTEVCTGRCASPGEEGGAFGEGTVGREGKGRIVGVDEAEGLRQSVCGFEELPRIPGNREPQKAVERGTDEI